jgi:hypothetical protein
VKTRRQSSPEDLRIEYRPLSQFERALRNPKGHSIPEIQASMRRFGFVEPGVLNEATGRLVAGHGRAEVLDLMKAAGEKPPGRIREKGGEWLVPVLRGVSFASDVDAEAYLVASNRLVELGGWNEAELAKVLTDLKAETFGLEGVEFAEEDIAGLAAADPSKVDFPEFDEDAANDVKYVECPACGHKFPK